MSNNINSQSVTRSPIAIGWFRWLTWLLVIAGGYQFIYYILLIIFGPSAVPHYGGISPPARITWWDAIHRIVDGFLWIACIGILMRNRLLASIAVILLWTSVVLMCVDMTIDLVHGKLYLGDFFAPLIYAGFALDLARTLRVSARSMSE